MSGKTALLIVDVQNDYFSGGKFPLVNSDLALKKVQGLLELGRSKKWLIVHVQHIANDVNKAFFLPDTEGVKIHSSLTPLMEETVIEKHTPDSFFETDLEEKLKAADIEHLVICGMMSQHCIDSTVRSAYQKRYEIILVQDACATRDLEFQGNRIPAKQVHEVFMAGLQGFSKVVDYSTLKNNMV